MNPPTENALTAEPATVAASMKLAILGATGSVGRELVAQALAAGHEVTALVRAQPKPGEIDDRVALVIGDATSADAVKRTVQGRDAVLSALGHAKGATRRPPCAGELEPDRRDAGGRRQPARRALVGRSRRCCRPAEPPLSGSPRPATGGDAAASCAITASRPA